MSASGDELLVPLPPRHQPHRHQARAHAAPSTDPDYVTPDDLPTAPAVAPRSSAPGSAELDRTDDEIAATMLALCRLRNLRSQGRTGAYAGSSGRGAVPAAPCGYQPATSREAGAHLEPTYAELL